MTEHSVNLQVLAVMLMLLLARAAVSVQTALAQDMQSGKPDEAQSIQLSDEEQKTVQSVLEAMRLREMAAREAVARLEAARNAYLAVIYKFLSDHRLKSSDYELGQDMKSFVRKGKKSEAPLPPLISKE